MASIREWAEAEGVLDDLAVSIAYGGRTPA